MSTSPLTEKLVLPNGVVLPNRLAKAATSEQLATRHGAPTRQLIEGYAHLARSGAGLLISGNVMVDGSALEARRNVVVEDDRHLPALRRWAAVTEGTDVRFLLQLSHPGRQSMRGGSVAGRGQDVVAPSAVPLSLGKALFRPPRALSDAEVTAVVARFARTAAIAAEAGFAGVQVHGAHGYLLNQFLSPLVNRRTDRWGGSLDNRMRLLLEVVRAVRSATPAEFVLAVKLNSADFQRGGFDPDDALVVAGELEREGVHLVEVSGGNYESTAMLSGRTPERASTQAREAYFLDFAERFAKELTIPLMLTGGFRTRQGMVDAIEGGAVDLIGLARPVMLEPDLPRRLLDGTAQRSLVTPRTLGVKNLDTLLDSAWHQQQFARLGRGRPLRPNRHPLVALGIGVLTALRDTTVARFPI
jgi:2,4-dienoyl-CoA reductase-like NADH-dependent reductase (Old Yellow Enzyme family)